MILNKEYVWNVVSGDSEFGYFDVTRWWYEYTKHYVPVHFSRAQNSLHSHLFIYYTRTSEISYNSCTVYFILVGLSSEI